MLLAKPVRELVNIAQRSGGSNLWSGFSVDIPSHARPKAKILPRARRSPLKRVWREWRIALSEVWRRRGSLAGFQFGYALAFGVVLSTAVGCLLDHLLRSGGSVAITNYDLAGFFLSLRGLAFLFILACAWSAFFLAERSGLLLLAADRKAGTVGPAEALWRSLVQLPQLARLGLWYIAIFALLLVPFAALGAAAGLVLLGQHDINYYLYHEPPEWWLALACGGVLGLTYGILALALWFRLLFAVQLVLFHNAPPRAALLQSWSLTRGRALRLAVPLGGWWLVTGLVTTALSAGVSALGGLVLAAAGAHVGAAVAIVALFGLVLTVVALAGRNISAAGETLLAQRYYLACGGSTPATANGTGEIATRPRAFSTGTFVGLAAAAYLAALAFVGWRLASANVQEQFTVTAHRAGADKAPENTLAALRQAIADGADFAEIDVQTTHDGELVILHDGDLKRLAGDARRVEELSLAELRSLDIGRWKGAAFAGEHVATLGEMVAVAKGRIRLNVELKYNRDDPTLAPLVVELLRSEGFLDQCIITSIEYSAVKDAKRLAPEVQVGLIVTKMVGDPVALDADFLSMNQDAVSAKLIDRAHAHGKQIHVWTVNDHDSLVRMIELGVDSLITDLPAAAVELRQSRARLTSPEKLVLWLRSLCLTR